MSLFIQPLTINGTALPDRAQFGLQVRVTPIGGRTMHRLSDGSAVLQTMWRKRRVTISASGWVPPELDSINWSAPVTVAGQSLPAEITGYSDGPEETRNPQTAEFGWTLTIEEA